MKALEAYLFFDGNCREAMTFYQICFGGKLELMSMADVPEGNCPPGMEDKIMHASLATPAFNLLASDDEQQAKIAGTYIHLALQCESLAEIETLFSRLSEDGEVVQPPEDTFWNARFAMLIDKFGIRWMLNCPL